MALELADKKMKKQMKRIYRFSLFSCAKRHTIFLFGNESDCTSSIGDTGIVALIYGALFHPRCRGALIESRIYSARRGQICA